MVSGNLSGLNLSATGLLLSVGVLVLIYELLVWTHWWDIFTPLLLHRLGEHRGRGITSCFYCSQLLLCPVTKPGVGTEVSLCVGGWWATKHESEWGTSACQVFGLPSFTLVRAMSSCFLRGYSASLWTIHSVGLRRMCSSWKTEKNPSPHLPYQWLILSRGPYSPTLKWFSVRHTPAQVLHSSSALWSVYTRRRLSGLIQKRSLFCSVRVSIRIFN